MFVNHSLKSICKQELFYKKPANVRERAIKYTKAEASRRLTSSSHTKLFLLKNFSSIYFSALNIFSFLFYMMLLWKLVSFRVEKVGLWCHEKTTKKGGEENFFLFVEYEIYSNLWQFIIVASPSSSRQTPEKLRRPQCFLFISNDKLTAILQYTAATVSRCDKAK